MATIEEWEVIDESAKKLLLMTDAQRKKYISDILECAENNRDKTILCFFYIYGMRPEELLQLTRGHFNIRETDILVRLPTAKKGQERYITLSKTTPFMDYIEKWVRLTPLSDWLIFRQWKDPTNFNKAVKRLEKRYEERHKQKICLSPYVFRKFRISYLWEKGATSKDLLAWKGGKSIKVVEDSYAYTKPVTKFRDDIK